MLVYRGGEVKVLEKVYDYDWTFEHSQVDDFICYLATVHGAQEIVCANSISKLNFVCPSN